MSVKIRNYQKSDYEATLRILGELSEDYRFNFREETWKEESGLRLFSPGYKRMTLVAEIEGEIVGMGFIEVRTEPTGEVMGYLSNWGVVKEYHRRGIGEQLLNKAVTILEQFHVDAVRLNFGYNVSRKFLDRVTQGGFIPIIITCERALGEPTAEPEVEPPQSTQRITVRNYKKSDSEATTKIFRELAKEYNLLFEEDKWQESSGLRLFSPGYRRMTLIAEATGEVVGLGFIEVKTEPTGEIVGYLSNWGVAKAYLGKGIGGQLMEKAVSILQKMGADAVRINFGYDVNPKLLEHVAKIGFKPVAIACERKI